MYEAKGGLMLTEHLLGVPLPRHLNSLIAQIPGVGAAFATMLPIVGVLLAIEIIVKLIEKHEELKKAVMKAAEEVADMTVKQQDQANALVLTNLRLDDQIAKLEGRPSKNKLQEAMIEAHDAVDKLATGFAADFTKIDAVIIDATTLTERFKQGLAGGNNITTLWTGIPQVQRALESFNVSLAKVNETRMKLADAPIGSDEEKKLTAELSQNYIALKNSAQEALTTTQDYSSKDVKLISNLQQAYIAAGHAVQDLHLVEAQVPKKEKIDDLTDRTKAYKDELANLRLVVKGEDDHAAALRHLAQTQAETATAAMKEKPKSTEDADIDADRDKKISAAHDVYLAEVSAADQTLAGKKKLYDEELKDVSLTADKKKQLATTLANDQQHYDDTVAQAGANYDKASVVAFASAEAEKRAEAEKTAHQLSATQDEELRFTLSENAAKKAAAMESAHALLAEQQLSRGRALAIEKQAVQAQVQADLAALNKRESDLDKKDADYLKKMQKFEDDKAKIEQHGNAELKKLDDDADKQRVKSAQQFMDRYTGAINSSMAKTIVEGKNFTQAMKKMATQVTEDAIEQLLKWLEHKIEANMAARFSDAQTAASNAMKQYPFPANIPIAAAAFVATLAFANGGEVPGYGSGDTVPAMLTPGETVVTKALTQQVAASQGRQQSKGGELHMHFSPTVSAIDASGVDKMLDKHAAIFQKKMNDHIRKMNASRR